MTSRLGMEEEALGWGVPSEGLYYNEEVAVFSQSALIELTAKFHLTPVATAGSYDGLPLGQGDRWLMIFKKALSKEG